MPIDIGQAVGYITLDTKGFSNGLKTAGEDLNGFQKNANGLANGLNSVGGSMVSIGSTLTKNVTLPLVGVGAVMLNTATNFEKSMSGVKAISGATGAEFEKLRNQAIDLGASTSFSSGEVANAMTEMAKAGWKTEQILDGMSGVLDAAAASGEELGTVSTIIADSITGFGLAASDSSKIADLLTQAANSGTIGIAELGESFKYIAPVAKATGISIEDATTAISAMSMAGIKGSQAGTSLRTMITNLAKPSDDVAAAMKALNFEVSNSDGSFKDLDQIVAELRKSFSGMSEEQKAYYAATLAGKEGMSGLLSLLSLTQEEYDALGKSMENSSGVAKETAEVMQDNLKSKLEQLGGAFESLSIRLGDLVIPRLTEFVTKITGVVDAFTNLNPKTQETILKIAGIAAVAGPTLVVLGNITRGVGSLISTFSGLSAVLSGGSASVTVLGTTIGALTGPILAIIAAIAAIGATIAYIWQTNEEFRNSITETFNSIVENVQTFVTAFMQKVNEIGVLLQPYIDGWKNIFQQFCDFLAPLMSGLFANIGSAIQLALNTILGIFDFFIAFLKGDWQGCWDALVGILEGFITFVCEIITNFGTTFRAILDEVLSWFGTSWNEVFTTARDFVVNIFTEIQNGISTALNFIKNLISMFKEDFWGTLAMIITKIVEFKTKLVLKAIEAAKGFVDSLINGVKKLPEMFMEIGTNIVNGIWKGISSGWSWLTEQVGRLASSLFEAAKSALGIHSPSTKFAWIAEMSLTGFGNKFTSMFPKISSLVSNSLNSLAGNSVDLGDMDITNKWSSAKLWFEDLKTTAADAINSVNEMMNNLFAQYGDIAILADGSGTISYKDLIGKDSAQFIGADDNDTVGKKSDGDTFNFYSQAKLTEAECAREFRKTKRKIDEGL